MKFGDNLITYLCHIMLKSPLTYTKHTRNSGQKPQFKDLITGYTKQTKYNVVINKQKTCHNDKPC